MRKEEFFEVLGDLDDDIVRAAEAPVKKKRNVRIWGTAAACLAAVVIAGSMIPQRIPAETDPQRNETAVVTENIAIYYLSEKGAIENKRIEVRCTPEDIFKEWTILNNITDVTLVHCAYSDGGSEKLHEGTVEHTSGNYFTLTLTVSAAFSPYAEGEQGDLLIQSLRQSFCDYIPVDDFNLIIDD